MTTIDHLSKHLTHDEYTAAADLYTRVIAHVSDPVKAAAMMYRQGRLNGMDEARAAVRIKAQKDRLFRERLRQAAAENIISPPEATTEGSESDNG